MGSAETKPISIHLDGWDLLESKVGFWGDYKYVFYDKVGKETLIILIDPRRGANYRVTVTSSSDNYMVRTITTGSIDMIRQFIQKRYGKFSLTEDMEEIPLDI